MKEKLLVKLLTVILPRLLDLAIKVLEEKINFDIDGDNKIGK
jgi:hypothetical protein